MSAHAIAVDVLLGLAVAACWLGVIGMLRMPHPTQALQYLQLPGVAMFAVTVALFLKTGPSSAAFKTVLIAIVLMGINSVVTHATARAFRVRHLGHWEPLDGDPIEFVPSSHHPEKRP
ncbi:MAG: monovalent cation/H(+) antiporter subunit G [Acidobacteriota bacterium]